MLNSQGLTVEKCSCHPLISSLPGLALRTLVESLGKTCDVNKRSQSPA